MTTYLSFDEALKEFNLLVKQYDVKKQDYHSAAKNISGLSSGLPNKQEFIEKEKEKKVEKQFGSFSTPEQQTSEVSNQVAPITKNNEIIINLDETDESTNWIKNIRNPETGLTTREELLLDSLKKYLNKRKLRNNKQE